MLDFDAMTLAWIGTATLVAFVVRAGLEPPFGPAWLRARLRNSPPLLADTLAELRVDAALLRGESPPRHPNGSA